MRKLFSAARLFTVCAVAAIAGSACQDGPTSSQTLAVRDVTISPNGLALSAGNAFPMQATALGGSGIILNNRTFTWMSSNTAVATVSATGVVTGIAVGEAVVTATSDGHSGRSTIYVTRAVARNFTIVDAQFTQGVQAADGSIPMVRGGESAALNVMISATETATAPGTQVVLRLFDANNVLFRADTGVTGNLFVPAPTTSIPTIQFLLSPAVLQTTARWQVVRDPKHQVVDSDSTDDVFPRTGPAPFLAVDLPAVTLRLVPISLTAHNWNTPLQASQIPNFLRSVQSIMPVSGLATSIAPSLATQAVFGLTTAGGDLPFWAQVLSEIDLARTLDPGDRSRYWVAVVVPPSTFSRTVFGGLAYVPGNGAANGPGTRSLALIGPGYYANAAGARDGLAHELGHTFGRLHAPCGQPTAIDPGFPNPGGIIGTPGHDVWTWARGLTTSAAVVAAESPDVMGYCTGPWASPYTYNAELQFRRQTVGAVVGAAEAPQRVLILRGTVAANQSVQLEPAFVTTAVPARPTGIGTFRVEGLDGDGRILFAYAFAPSVIDHAQTQGQFLFALPLDDALENSLATVRVISGAPTPSVRSSANALRAAASRSASSSASNAPETAPALRQLSQGTGIAMVRNAKGLVAVTCPAAYNAGVLVQQASGELLTTAARGTATFGAARGIALLVHCSDGVQSTSLSAKAP